MIRRNTTQNVNIKSKITIYNSLLIYILPYASWPSRSDMRQSNAMNKRITNRILPVENYKERLFNLNCHPISITKKLFSLKELLLLFNIISNKYNVEFAHFYEMENSTRRGMRFKLPSLRCEALRHNF